MSNWNENKESRRHFKLDIFDYAVELSQRIDGKAEQTELIILLRQFALECVHGATSALFKEKVVNDHHYRENDVDAALVVHKMILERSYDGQDELEELLKDINEAFLEAMRIDKLSTRVLLWSAIPFIALTFIMLSMFGFWGAVAIPVLYFVLGVSLRYYITKNKTLDLLAEVLIELDDTTSEV